MGTSFDAGTILVRERLEALLVLVATIAWKSLQRRRGAETENAMPKAG
jgi:hypothetical protein